MTVALSASFRDRPTVRHILRQCDRVYTTQEVSAVRVDLGLDCDDDDDVVKPIPDQCNDLTAFLAKRHECDLVFTYSDLHLLSQPFNLSVIAPKRILENVCANFARVVEKVHSLSSVCDELVAWCEQGTALCRGVADTNTMALLDRWCEQLRSRLGPPAATALTPVTQAQFRAWLDDLGQHCPHCQSRKINAQDIDTSEPDSLYQIVQCPDCGRKYGEIYVLMGLQELDSSGTAIDTQMISDPDDPPAAS